MRHREAQKALLESHFVKERMNDVLDTLQKALRELQLGERGLHPSRRLQRQITITDAVIKLRSFGREPLPLEEC